MTRLALNIILKTIMNMKSFYLRYIAETLASISVRAEQQNLPIPIWRFLFSDLDAEIYIFDSLQDQNGLKLHVGLEIIVHIKEEDENQATSKSKNLVEFILNLISFESLSSCKPAKLKGIIDTTKADSCPINLFTRPFEENFPYSSLVQIDRKRFDIIWKAFGASKNKARIMRSLTWIRKGIDSENKVDEFISYWIAIEAFEPLLRKASTWDGIRDIFSQKEIESTSSFTTIKGARQKLFHAFNELSDDFVDELKKYLFPMRRTAIYGILLALDISKNSIDYGNLLNRDPHRIEVRPYSIQKGKLVNLSIDSPDFLINFPRTVFDLKEKNISFNKDGSLNFTWKSTYKYILPKDCKFLLEIEELWGDEKISKYNSNK